MAYETSLGKMYVASAEGFMESSAGRSCRGRVKLIFTSPPFALNNKKKYGNLKGEEYVAWLSSYADRFRQLLKPNGSIVIELGNAWESGRPIMSTLALKSLLAFLDAGKFVLCQQFICYNPARLPTPAQWVTIERIRVKDAYTHLWWMSTSDRPDADNRRVLQQYSKSMLRLLNTESYNSGKRPSGHHIGTRSFLKENAGAIPSNVLTFSNTSSADRYQQYCRSNGLALHPARMPGGLVDFFVRFLSSPGDLVMDPFAGSNTTGAAAEALRRRWIGIEPNSEYVAGSAGRFTGRQMELLG
jgi:site-specific DNA-methyltransferase (cytosine-N4-specific)